MTNFFPGQYKDINDAIRKTHEEVGDYVKAKIDACRQFNFCTINLDPENRQTSLNQFENFVKNQNFSKSLERKTEYVLKGYCQDSTSTSSSSSTPSSSSSQASGFSFADMSVTNTNLSQADKLTSLSSAFANSVISQCSDESSNCPRSITTIYKQTALVSASSHAEEETTQYLNPGVEDKLYIKKK